jgi:hypothetical protein
MKMTRNLRILAQKIGGALMLIATVCLVPIADGNITYAIVTVPFGLLFLFADFVIGDDDYDEEEDLEWDEL